MIGLGELWGTSRHVRCSMNYSPVLHSLLGSAGERNVLLLPLLKVMTETFGMDTSSLRKH